MNIGSSESILIARKTSWELEYQMVVTASANATEFQTESFVT